MRVNKLTLSILVFFSVTLVKTAEANVTASSNSTKSVTQNNGTNLINSIQINETGSIVNETVKSNETYHNLTSEKDIGIVRLFRDNNGAVLRAFYVIVGVTAIVVVYFIIRSLRLRRKRSKTRKYGITGKNIGLEMTPLDQEEDDDDLTVFEAPKSVKR